MGLGRLQRIPAREFTAFAGLLSDPAMIVAVLSVVGAAWLPVSWFWRPEGGAPAPAGMDGPASWIAHWWFRPESPACFQPLVPLASLWVAWAHRSAVAREISAAQAPGRTAFSPWLQWWRLPFLPIGLILLAVSHLSHVPTFAVTALQFILWGLLQHAAGAKVLRAARIPMVLLFTMTFPPETVWGIVRDTPAGWTAQSVVAVGSRLGMAWSLDGVVVQTPAGAFDLGLRRCFSAAVVGTAFWTLVAGLAGRLSRGSMLAGIALATTAVGLLDLLCCVAALLLKPKLPWLSAALLSSTAWIWFIPSFGLGMTVFGRRFRATRRADRRGADIGEAFEVGNRERIKPGVSIPRFRLDAMVRRRLATGSLAVLVVSLFGTWSTTRLLAAGSWLPSIPESIGDWEGTIVPEDPIILRILGNPRMVGRTYRNQFNDRVEFSLVTAGMFENYHDPTVCVGGGDYRLTGSRNVPIGSGPEQARAMIFRHRRNPDHRIVMWYWQQFQDGSTDTESRMGNFRDFFARLRTGYSSILQGKKTVLIRIFAPFDIRRDPDAGLAQDQVGQIARAVHRHLRQNQ